ncbi:MAG: hypothetical protein DRP59_13170 [Spirochaetes bacterium]|nr:MAG: hypothetical protein DRP59_13170 [Spirochaetota bacterium]
MLMLILLFMFEYFVSPMVIPAYTDIHAYRILLASLSIAVLFLFPLFSEKKALFIQYLLIAVFMVVRLDEVLNILPKIHLPGLLLSLFLFSNFFSIFILVFYTNYSLSRGAAAVFLVYSIVCEIFYFRKMKDLPPILIILVVTITASTAVIAALMKKELKQKKEIKRLYEDEVALKNKIAMIKMRMLEQEKSFSLSLLTAGIAHELGNPINYLQGNLFFIEEYFKTLTGMIDRDSLEKKDAENLDRIIRDSDAILEHAKTGFKSITAIVENMKKLYGRKNSGKEKQDIKEVLVRTIDFFKVSHNSSSYTIETDFHPGLFVNIHSGEYYIVFSNILTNALESIELSGRKGVIKISAYSDQNHVIVSISDNGSGIPEDVIDKVFDPFFSTKNVDNNLGLGLALCRDIVEADGGKIEIESKKSIGTTINIIMERCNEER